MIELVAIAPLLAVMIIVIVQFAGLFRDVIHDLSLAEARAARSILEWGASHGSDGFERPCLELIPERAFRSRTHASIGVGAWKRDFDIPQEVRVVADPICQD